MASPETSDRSAFELNTIDTGPRARLQVDNRSASQSSILTLSTIGSTHQQSAPDLHHARPSQEQPAVAGPNANATLRNSISTTDQTPESGRRGRFYPEWKAREDSNQNLKLLDVIAVVYNKMVGTGIFTTPGTVLRLTGSKRVSLGLWAVGGLYTWLCLTVYLEYGTALPYNGAELIYLDAVYRRYRFGFMFSVMFAGFFIAIANTTGNAIAFARFVMVAASPGIKKSQDLDERIVRLIAIIALSVVCLLHYFSGAIGLALNKLLAAYKICLLLAVFIAGMLVRNVGGNKDAGIPDTGEIDFRDENPTRWTGNLTALVYILYSYTGWENANYVAGEIQDPTKHASRSSEPTKEEKRYRGRTLRRGAYTAIVLVTAEYLLVAAAYYVSVDYKDIVSQDSDSIAQGTDLGMGILFGPKAFGGNGTSLKVLIAISALGNLVAVTYTSAKVKQTIALQGLIPFYKFFRREGPTPYGGLVLHWTATTIMIVATPATSDGYSFVVGLYTYGQVFIVGLVTFGLIWLPSSSRIIETPWTPSTWLLSYSPIRYFVTALIVGATMFIMVVGAWSPGGTTKDIPRYRWPIVIFTTFGISIVYWIGLQILQTNSCKANTGFGVVIGNTENEGHWRGDGITGLDAHAREQAQKDGTNRRLFYTTPEIPESVKKPFAGLKKNAAVKWIRQYV